ncbi:MAG: hypothetical protein FJW35_14750 [Acidobacteria bacterium]|nr:hypothetical protein [Acidobacteriota bacterium]
MIFETGGFPPGFNDIWSQLTIVDTMINPETGLPYVHDNRVVPPADKALDPGLIETLKDLNELRKRLRMRFLDN